MSQVQYQGRFDPPVGSISPLAGLKGYQSDGPSYFLRKRSNFFLDTVNNPVRQRYFNRTNFNTIDGSGTISSLDIDTPAGTLTGSCAIVTVKAGVAGGPTGVTTITDANGNVYTLAVEITNTDGGNGYRTSIFFANNLVLTLPNTITAHFATAVGQSAINVATYEVAGSTLYLDTTASGTGGSGSATTSAYTTTSANDLVVSAATIYGTSGGTFTISDDSVKLIQDASGILSSSDRVPNSILSGVTTTASYSSSVTIDIILAAFKLTAPVSVFSDSVFPSYTDRFKLRSQEYEFQPTPFAQLQAVPTQYKFEGPAYFLRKPSPVESREFKPTFTPAVATTFFDSFYPPYIDVRKKGRVESQEFKPTLKIENPVPYSESFYLEYIHRAKVGRIESEFFRPNRGVPGFLPTQYGALYPEYIFKRPTSRNPLGGESSPVSSGLTGHFQVSDGYPIVIEPSELTASYEEVIDYGLVISNIIATLTYSVNTIVGSVSVTPKMAYSTDNITYSAFTTGPTTFATSFRYLKVRFEFAGSDDKSIIQFYNLQIRLNVKREVDSGTIDALASDVSGTVVTFNKAFKDIDSITVSPLATVQITAIYDFIDVPNPVSFKILAYDAAGVRCDATVSWKARGII